MKNVNFGRGTRASYGPGTPNEDVVLDIPISGEIPSVNNNQNALYERFANYTPSCSAEAVVVAVPREELDELSDWARANEVRLYWVEERGEWVAFYFHEWVEDV